MTRIKVVFVSDTQSGTGTIRIFKSTTDDTSLVNCSQILDEIHSFVQNSVGIDTFHSFTLQYIDHENEKIVIDDGSDLQECIAYYQSINKTTKVFVQPSADSLGSDESSAKISAGPSASDEWYLPQKHEPSSTSQSPTAIATPDPDQPPLQQSIAATEDGDSVQTQTESESEPLSTREQWIVHASEQSQAVRNPIRDIVDRLDMSNLPADKEFISISIGDPTKFPNLLPSATVTKAVQTVLLSQQWNGYAASFGHEESRVAIAKKHSSANMIYDMNDVILGNGCSDAIVMAINSLLDVGQNILLPKPGFPFYDTVVNRFNLESKYYHLLAEDNWAIDVAQMESLIDANTKAILINNPSNPCGSVFTKQNILQVLAVAARHRIPVISDEIYGGMVFGNNNSNHNSDHSEDNGTDHGEDTACKFYSMADLSTKVPVLVLSGLAKQYLVPGWRMGWIVIHDPIQGMHTVRDSLRRLSTVLLGPNTLIQAALPAILFETPKSFYAELNDKLYRQSALLFEEFSNIACLKPIQCYGAMYMMCQIKFELLNDDIKDDIDFANLLLQKQALLVLPGTIFGAEGYFRAVVCPPPNVIVEIGQRMQQFCQEYAAVNTVDNDGNVARKQDAIAAKL